MPSGSGGAYGYNATQSTPIVVIPPIETPSPAVVPAVPEPRKLLPVVPVPTSPQSPPSESSSSSIGESPVVSDILRISAPGNNTPKGQTATPAPQKSVSRLSAAAAVGASQSAPVLVAIATFVANIFRGIFHIFGF
jgi:hypothetical protein